MIRKLKPWNKVLVSALAFLLVLLSVYSGYQVISAARRYIWNENTEKKGKGELGSELLSKAKAMSTETASNTFTILEVVPYPGMAEIGYMVGGQEPIDLSKFNNLNSVGITSYLGNMIIPRSTYVEKETLTLEEQQENTKYNNWSDIYVATLDTGYFEPSTDSSEVLYVKEGWSHDAYVRVTDNSGQYQAVLERLDFYSQVSGMKLSNKNVKALFYNESDPNKGKFTKFNSDQFVVRNAKENITHEGDYDYDLDNDVFYLNENKGEYDVEFMPQGYMRDFGKTYYMTNQYEIVEDGKGTYTGIFSYKDVGSGNGQYKKEVRNPEYTLTNGGGDTYRWHSVNNVKPLDPSIPVTTRVVHKRMKCHYGCEYVNTEWFKRYAMRLDKSEYEDWDIKVITVTPQELNEHKELVEQANMVFLSNNVQNRAYIGFWETFGWTKDEYGVTESNRYSDCRFNEATGALDNVASLKPGKSMPNFIGNDIDWDITCLLFKRIGIDRDLPAVFNSSIYETNQTELDGKGNSTINNFAKLYIMLRQQDPVRFQTEYFDKNLIEKIDVPNNNVSTGSYKALSGKAAYIWCSETFLPKFSGGIGPEEFYINQGIDNYNMVGNNSVVDDMYTFKSDCIIDGLFIKKNEEYKGKWFYDVQEFIFLYENPDFVGTPSESQIKNQQLAPCDIFFYLLHDKLNKLKIPNLTVLDLEPCKDYTLTEEKIRNMVKNYSGPIKIVHMTTAEFNGKLEDLNSTYNMIYMGLNDGMFSKSLGKTVYNDHALDRKVYLHIGDQVVGGIALKGLAQNETANYNTYRFSGNDITSKKKTELEEFLKAGFPIVVNQDLYTLNDEKIDPQSRIYSFISDNKGGVKPVPTKIAEMNNLINEGLFDENLFNQNTKTVAISKIKDCLMRHESPVIEFGIPGGESPVEYDGYTLQDSNRLKFIFQIQQKVLPLSETNTLKYTVKLYIDRNANGIYGDQSGELLEPPLTDQLANTNILIDKEIPSDCYGIIPWKLEVSRQNKDSNPNVTMLRSSISGCYGVDKKGVKKHLNILQITPTKIGSVINLQTELGNSSSKFYTYANNLNDFTFTITTIDKSEFESWYVDTSDVSKRYIRGKISNNPLAEYDMVILGFGDYYSNISNQNGAVDNLFDYIESGKSVLFTRDTTSIVNQNSSSQPYVTGVPNWGYNFNQFLRNRIGMNRFGVTTPTSLSYESVLDNHDKKDYANPSGDEYTEKQGFTYSALCQYSRTPADKFQESDIPVSQRGPFKNIPILNSVDLESIDTDSYNTKTITNVNTGQITDYPYKIPRSGDFIPDSTNAQTCGFAISDTHAQYYELDLEDPEMVVWYCLSNEQTNQVYSSSPNDVRNNYYIYNKGNVTYTGVGNSDFINNDMEIKLFINTMIAAYVASGEAPDIKVVGGIEKSSNESLLYIDSDYNDRNKVTADAEQIIITFTVEDEQDESGEALIRLYDIAGELTEIKIYDESNIEVDNKVNTHKVNGKYKEYHFSYPKKKLDDKEFANLSITATSSKYTGNETVTLLRRNLFNLN